MAPALEGRQELVPDIYSHRTNYDGLKAILQDGAIRPVADISADHPDRELSVEPTIAPFLRRKVRASEAASSAWSLMPERQQEIYLTRNGMLGGKKYGDYVITKRLAKVDPSPHLNTVKDEYVYRRPLSIRSNATIYVPDEELDMWRAEHPKVRFGAKSSLDLPVYSPYNVAEFARKLKDRSFQEKTAGVLDDFDNLFQNYLSRGGAPQVVDGTGEDQAVPPSLEEMRALAGRRTHYHGSKALGLDHENSDVDFLSILPSREAVYAKVEELKGKGFHKLPIPLDGIIDPDENMLIPMRGTIRGVQVDLMLAHGPQAENRVKTVYRANEFLNGSRRDQIRERKKDLKDSWFLGKKRHGRYVEGLDRELGIAPLWARRDGSTDTPEPIVTERDLRRWFGPNARFTGSTALGINLPDSDVDVFVPYKGEDYYRRAVRRLEEKGLNLQSSPYNSNREGAHVFSGTIPYNGRELEVDVTFGTGQKAWERQRSIEEAASRLSEDDRIKIRRKKEALKNAWLFPEKRYTNYKRRLDDDLGIILL